MTTVGINREAGEEWRTSDSQIARLQDPDLKVAVIVSPGNPIDKTMDEKLLDGLEASLEDNPDLVILCDYVYANFVQEQYDNALERMPRNVVPFYAISKDFGLAGARVGATWIHPDGCLQRMLCSQPDRVAERVDARYESRHIDGRPTFYDRLVMDSAGVSFSHMAGISVPNQVLFALCALYPLVNPEEKTAYFDWLRGELRSRMNALYDGLGIPRDDACPLCASNYCTVVPLEEMARAQGPQVAGKFEDVSLWDFLLHLAHSRGTILMPAPAFGAGEKTVRICLTSLGTTEYRKVGRNIAETIGDYSLPTDCSHCQDS